MTAAIETPSLHEPPSASSDGADKSLPDKSVTPKHGFWSHRLPIYWIEAARLRQLGCSIFDQGFSVGGMFLANITLARTQTKEEYGIFTLTYSVFTFLSGLHNAAVLEAYTIYGSGLRTNHLNGFWAFAIAALAWSAASVFVAREIPENSARENFLQIEPRYWLSIGGIPAGFSSPRWSFNF